MRVWEELMIPSIGPSLSGIRASFKLLDATSSNIANVETPGYKAKTTAFMETGGGVSAVTSTDSSPGPTFQLDGRVFEGSNVDVSSEIVSLMTARHMFSLNAAAFRTANETEKHLLDTLA